MKSLKKSEFILVAQHYKLEISSTLKKSELKNLVIEHLVEEELVSDDDSDLPDTASATRNTPELRRLGLQDRERERESQLRLKELEIRQKELSVQLQMRELETPPAVAPRPTGTSTPQFDISKHIRFVPPFQEKEVDKYFLHYEKIAMSLEWPRET